jgi:hypothetical protein
MLELLALETNHRDTGAREHVWMTRVVSSGPSEGVFALGCACGLDEIPSGLGNLIHTTFGAIDQSCMRQGARPIFRNALANRTLHSSSVSRSWSVEKDSI